MFRHNRQMSSIAAELLPKINASEEQCAGMVFMNRYLMAVLASLEPNHPLLEVGFREKIARWGEFSYQDANGNEQQRLSVAVEAGASFSIPNFVNKAGLILKERERRESESRGDQTDEGATLHEQLRAHTLAYQQWSADSARGIHAPEPVNPISEYMLKHYESERARRQLESTAQEGFIPRG